VPGLFTVAPEGPPEIEQAFSRPAVHVHSRSARAAHIELHCPADQVPDWAGYTVLPAECTPTLSSGTRKHLASSKEWRQIMCSRGALCLSSGVAVCALAVSVSSPSLVVASPTDVAATILERAPQANTGYG
jgi:hypothetical protein